MKRLLKISCAVVLFLMLLDLYGCSYYSVNFTDDWKREEENAGGALFQDFLYYKDTTYNIHYSVPNDRELKELLVIYDERVYFVTTADCEDESYKKTWIIAEPFSRAR